MVQFRLKYLMDWTNWLELVLYFSTVLFVFVFGAPCLCPRNWQWQFGILAVFLAWINLVLFIQKFPLIGIYIVMFLKIVYTFLWTVVLSLLLLTAFGLAFYMAFYEPVYKVSVLFRCCLVSFSAVCIIYTTYNYIINCGSLNLRLIAIVTCQHFVHCTCMPLSLNIVVFAFWT